LRSTYLAALGRESRGMIVQDENGVYRSLARERRNQRRKQLGVGLAGLAAIVSAAAFAAQSGLIDLTPSRSTAARKPVPPVSAPHRQTQQKPLPSASRTTAVVAPTRGRATRAAVRQKKSPPPPPPPPPPSRPNPASAASAASAAGLVAGELRRRNETVESGTIQVTSAGFDLSGRPELAVAGDRGRAVGRARCTKNVRPAAAERVRAMPSMLVCWRTSATRSVVTVAVADHGRPAEAESLAVIEREWSRPN